MPAETYSWVQWNWPQVSKGARITVKSCFSKEGLLEGISVICGGFGAGGMQWPLCSGAGQQGACLSARIQFPEWIIYSEQGSWQIVEYPLAHHCFPKNSSIVFCSCEWPRLLGPSAAWLRLGGCSDSSTALASWITSPSTAQTHVHYLWMQPLTHNNTELTFPA